MLLTTLLIFALQDEPWSDTSQGIWSLPNGEYAERHADGSAACDDPDARRIAIAATGVEADANGGRASGGALRLALEPGDDETFAIRQLISAGEAAAAFQDRMISQIEAGRVSRGALDSTVSGSLLTLFLTAENGDISLISATFLGPGDAPNVTQVSEPAYAGRIGEDGPVLRAFSRCGPAEGTKP